jgi:hypothetical protein
MGFFRGLVRGVAGLGRGIAKGVGSVSKVVGGALGAVDSVMKSPVGQVVMAGLAANPKTRGASLALQQGIAQGQNLNSVIGGLSRGEQQAINQAVQMATQRSLGN